MSTSNPADFGTRAARIGTIYLPTSGQGVGTFEFVVDRTSLSGEERFSPGGFAVETLAGGALGLGAGRLFETVHRLRINPNRFKPSNVWNPGPWARRAYAQSGIEAGAGALGGFGTRSLVGFVAGC